MTTKLEALEFYAANVRERLAELEALLSNKPSDVTPELLEVAEAGAAAVRAALVEVDALIALAKRNGET